MTRKKRIIVLGTLAANPYAGMAWMHMQLATGLKRLGHDVYYFEVSSVWPYDPIRQRKVNDSDYALPYLTRVASDFGLSDRWAYRRSYSDGQWFGLSEMQAEDLLAHADAVINVTGATNVSEEGLRTGHLILYGTDPVIYEVAYAQGNSAARALVDQHDVVVTFGENIGTERSPIPPLPRQRTCTRQPVLIDLWQTTAASRQVFTTVGNWKQTGLDIVFRGEPYRWSKHHEYMRFLDLPQRCGQPIELAMNLATRREEPEDKEDVPSLGLDLNDRDLLLRHGWRLTEADFTTDPWKYRDYVQRSRGEFTVARDLNVRPKSGWFSERSACYLAAGRPVVTQDTGFGDVLPTGEGLFAFQTMDDVLIALDAIQSDYARQSRAASEIAAEFFRAETVLARLLAELGL